VKNGKLKKVLLINQQRTPHYRIPVYNYLSAYLEKVGYFLTVVSEGPQKGYSHQIEYSHIDIPLNFFNLASQIVKMDPDAIIYWVNLKHLYMLPLLIFIKLLKKKLIYWGHGIDLLGKRATKLKYFAYSFEHWISDAIILYGHHLKANLRSKYHHKTFIANNTLNFNDYKFKYSNKYEVLLKYNIETKINIICMGRMQRRKRLDHLFKAFALLGLDDVGLIFVGPDDEGALRDINGKNIYKIPPIYGNERLDLLSAADIFCIPGAIGLSIVDAFYCGLPIVTEADDVSPEIMYLKDGINGFVVPRNDIEQLTEKIRLLLDDDLLRKKFSLAAKEEISTNGHIDIMCDGFVEALHYVYNK
jgi:glycosyltransferase involved in cell wall biosynthesis